MRTIAGIVAVVVGTSGMMTLGEPIALTRIGNSAYAEGRRACYRKCRYHSWSAGRCLRYCRARAEFRDAAAVWSHSTLDPTRTS